jgi:hypothetical protein
MFTILSQQSVIESCPSILTKQRRHLINVFAQHPANCHSKKSNKFNRKAVGGAGDCLVQKEKNRLAPCDFNFSMRRATYDDKASCAL